MSQKAHSEECKAHSSQASSSWLSAAVIHRLKYLSSQKANSPVLLHFSPRTLILMTAEKNNWYQDAGDSHEGDAQEKTTRKHVHI